MGVSTKIEFRYRSVYTALDITDLACMLFPGNRRQQFAAVQILLTLKTAPALVPNLAFLQRDHGISRRVLQRTRAKLARLGLIEYVSWMNARSGGRSGWRISSRMAGALRRLADLLDTWSSERDPQRLRKDTMLAQTLRP